MTIIVYVKIREIYIQKLKIIFIVKQELFRNVCHMMNNRDRVLINSVRIIIVLFLIK